MPNKNLKVLVGVVALVLIAGLAVFMKPPIGYNQGYQPTQPIPYDHSLHAGKLEIPCQYCHSNASYARHSSVPALNICMNCHNQVKTQSEHIKKLADHYNEGKSIQWQKVHLLPDFVHFNHQRHVRRGVACQTCHGPIETMKEVFQYSDLSMGWCVNCHRKPENNAPVSCSTCHY
ncbi:MAG: cytochrome c3 family protein [Bdellovibrionota bacterium]|nr:cytochrome C [Pseudobdellovibrionaceae bacterium]MEC9283380.1 cytochrome c3 family protein [Bdellovibrionota bacterium]|tara:strand:- start:21023 stop:21547 length:525 start_codon:yes stop_codon:yes gene_type:complete